MNTSLRIWITGASTGIGAATAVALAKAGHRVFLTARNLAQLEKTCAAYPDLMEFAACDVTQADQVQACWEQQMKRWGGLDALIPNAGIGYFDPLKQAKLTEWQAMVDVNITGVLNTIHAALPALVASKGHVINIGSIAARQVFPNSGVYCATKHAVLAISESLRTEFREDLAVTTINPGAVNTPFIDRTTNDSLRSDYRPQFDEGMSPEYVAEAILFALESRGKGVVSELTIRPDIRKI